MIWKHFAVFCLIFLAGAVSVTAIQNTVFSDIDGDGDLDMYLEYLIETAGRNFYLLNSTDGIGNLANVKQGYFVDVDADGLEDLYVVRKASPNNLFISKGNKKFINRTGNWLGSNLSGGPGSPLAAAFADFNNNGIVDAFVNGNLFLDITSVLTFRNATNISNIDALPALRHVAAKDLNSDGNKDLVGASLNGTLIVFLSLGDSNGDGCPEFFDATVDMKLQGIRGVNFVESKNILTGVAVNQSLGFYPYSGISPPFVADNFSDIYLARNSSNRLFIQLFPDTREEYSVANASIFYLPHWLERSQGVNVSSNSTGAILADFDNNTALDLFVADGGPNSSLFLRNGSSWDDFFINQSNDFSMISFAKLAQAADVDNDGLLDIAYIDSSGILLGRNLMQGSAVFDVTPPAAGAPAMDVQENQVLTDSVLELGGLARAPPPACPDCTAGTITISNAGHLLLGAGGIGFEDKKPKERPVPRRREGGGSGAYIPFKEANISPRVEPAFPEFPPIDEPEEEKEEPGIKPEKEEEKRPVIPERELGTPSCANDSGVFIPGLGVVTGSGAFDYIDEGFRLAEYGTLIQDRHTRYAGPRVDFRKLDFDFGQHVVYCKEEIDVFSEYKPYFFLFDPDMFVAHFTSPTMIKEGEASMESIEPSCSCPDGKSSVLGLWLAEGKVATSRGLFDFSSVKPFEKERIVEVCLPSRGMFAGVMLALTELLADRLSGAGAAASECGVIEGSCTPYHDCSITAPANYRGERIADIDLPDGYVFATSLFSVPRCGGKVDASIVFPEGFEDIRLYRLSEGRYEAVDYSLSEGLVCDGRSWKAVVAETKQVVEREKSELVKVYDGGTRRSILLVHGLFSSSATFDQLIEELKYTNQPYSVYIYDYSSDAESTFDDAVDTLARELSRLDVDSLTIFAHSLGGLISEKALMVLDERQDVALDRIDRIVVAGTPHEGSKGLEDLGIVPGLLSSTLLASFPASEDIIDAALNGVATERVPGVEYVVFAGDKSSPLTTALLQREPNDGLVTVSSAKAIAADESFEFDLSHMALPDSSESIGELFRIVGESMDSTVPLKGYSRYMHIEDVPVGESLFVIAGKKEELGAPLDTCFLSRMILYFAGLLFVLALFLNPRSGWFYAAMAFALVLAIVSSLVCRSVPYLFLALLIAAYLMKRGFVKGVPASAGFDIAMALALHDVLNQRYSDRSVERVRDAFSRLDAKEQELRYGQLDEVSDAVNAFDREEVISRIERHAEAALRKAGRKKLERVKARLSSVREASPRLEFLLR